MDWGRPKPKGRLSGGSDPFDFPNAGLAGVLRNRAFRPQSAIKTEMGIQTVNKGNGKGYSLTQLVLVVAIIGILASIVYPGYKKYVRDAQMREALSELLAAAQFMERFYRQNGSFKQTSTRWPNLPNSGKLEHFCILPHGLARGALDSKFTLKAVSKDKEREPRVIKVNEALTVFICESTASSCDDAAKNYFSGADKDCSLYRP